MLGVQVHVARHDLRRVAASTSGRTCQRLFVTRTPHLAEAFWQWVHHRPPCKKHVPVARRRAAQARRAARVRAGRTRQRARRKSWKEGKVTSLTSKNEDLSSARRPLPTFETAANECRSRGRRQITTEDGTTAVLSTMSLCNNSVLRAALSPSRASAPRFQAAPDASPSCGPAPALVAVQAA